MLSCEEFRQSATTFEVLHRTGDLPPDLATHLAACDACRAYHGQMAQLEGQIRATAQIPVPPELLVHLRAIPGRRRALVEARNRILLPSAVAVLGALAAPLILGISSFWLSSGFALTGAFAAVAAGVRRRLIPD